MDTGLLSVVVSLIVIQTAALLYILDRVVRDANKRAMAWQNAAEGLMRYAPPAIVEETYMGLSAELPEKKDKAKAERRGQLATRTTLRIMDAGTPKVLNWEASGTSK